MNTDTQHKEQTEDQKLEQKRLSLIKEIRQAFHSHGFMPPGDLELQIRHMALKPGGHSQAPETTLGPGVVAEKAAEAAVFKPTESFDRDETHEGTPQRMAASNLP